MTDNSEQMPELPDPVQTAAETLLYGSPDDAAAALRNAIHAEADRILVGHFLGMTRAGSRAIEGRRPGANQSSG